MICLRTPIAAIERDVPEFSHSTTAWLSHRKMTWLPDHASPHRKIAWRTAYISLNWMSRPLKRRGQREENHESCQTPPRPLRSLASVSTDTWGRSGTLIVPYCRCHAHTQFIVYRSLRVGAGAWKCQQAHRDAEISLLAGKVSDMDEGQVR
jgi:hypothetical protein